MTNPQKEYNFIMNIIDSCETIFEIHIATDAITRFSASFPDEKGMKQNLIDMLNDVAQTIK